MEGVFDTVIPEIQHALRREHYEMPTPVQAQAIPPQVAGDDLFGSARVTSLTSTLPLSDGHDLPDAATDGFDLFDRAPKQKEVAAK